MKLEQWMALAAQALEGALAVHAGSGEAVARALLLRMEHLQALAESLP